MNRAKIAIYICDGEYRNRLTGYLLGHYRNQFELHIFTELSQLLEEKVRIYDVMLLGDCQTELAQIQRVRGEPIVYLSETEGETPADYNNSSVVCVMDKYAGADSIAEALRRVIGEQGVVTKGRTLRKKQIIGVYSLTESGFQLPFAITLASFLQESRRVLFVDLQENSGFSKMNPQAGELNLEDILVMISSGKWDGMRLATGIGHIKHMDYLYPAQNSEYLCEVDASLYLKLLDALEQEMDYEVILINFGARFLGFFQVLSRCERVYLMQRRGGIGVWREQEFYDEMEKKGLSELRNCMEKVEIPLLSGPMDSCERFVEQWRWNEFGDTIRRSLEREASFG